jgi:hypothetical protein
MVISVGIGGFGVTVTKDEQRETGASVFDAKEVSDSESENDISKQKERRKQKRREREGGKQNWKQ